VSLARLEYDDHAGARIVNAATVADVLHTVHARAQGKFLMGVRCVLMAAEPGVEQV
jgi:hypothetical protein